MRRQVHVAGLATLVLAAAAAAAMAGAAQATAARAEPAARPAAAMEPTGGVAYEGADRATMRVAPDFAAAVEDYANSGYRLRRGAGGREATVEVALAPLASRAPFSLLAGAAGAAVEEPESPAGAVSAAARSAVGDAETVYQAVSGVLGWIVHNVSASEPGTPASRSAPAGEAKPAAVKGPRATPPPVPPAQVIERGGGDAAEVARLAVAMLGAVGIEARAVHGRVVGPPRPGAPRGRHVWIEVRYPDRGWAFSDPLHHHHYVPATYLRLNEAAAGAATAGAGTAELVERDDRRVPADVYRAGGPGVGARRNDARQVAAVLRVVVPGAAEGAALLTAADGSRQRRALLGGEGVFVGLAGGGYTLEVLVPGRAGLSRRLELAPRERSAVFFGGEAAAEGAGAARRPPAPATPPDAAPTPPGRARRGAPR